MPHFMLLYFIKFSETRKLYPQPFCSVIFEVAGSWILCVCVLKVFGHTMKRLSSWRRLFLLNDYNSMHACHKFRDENKLLAKKTLFIVPTILKRSWILLVVLKSPWIRSRSLKSCNLVVTSIEFVRNLLSP